MIITTSMAVTKADESAIRDLVALAQESQSDTEALMNLHTPNTLIVNLAGRRVLGREAFAKAMVAGLASPLRDVLTTAEITDIRLVTPDVAIVSCTKTIRDGRSAATTRPEMPATAALTYVSVRSDDGWRIAVAQTTPVVTQPIDDVADLMEEAS